MGQRRAQSGTVHGLGGELAFAAQFVDHGGGFAVDAVQDLAMAVGLRVGHRHTALRQVFHQVQVKRQLFCRQPFEQGEHIVVLHAITHGAGKVVGVFDAALDATQGAQVAQAQALHQYTCFVLRDFRKNCHGRVRQPSELEHVPDARAGARLGPFALRGARARTLGGLDFVFGHVGLRGDRDALGLAAHPQFVDAGTAVLGADLLDPLVWTTFGGRLCLTRSRCLRQRSPAAPGQHGGGDQGQRAAQG